MNRRILVTGGAGFIGSHICDALVQRGHNVTSIDDMSGGLAGNIAHLCGKMNFLHVTAPCETDDTCQYIRDYKFDTLVHCAANARESASQFQPAVVTQRNYYAYMRTLVAALQGGVSRVVMFSSISVYGHGDFKPPFDEQLDPRPADIYAINKTAMERSTEVLSQVHGFRYVILRPHNVFGERQALHDKYRNVVGIWMNLIMRREPIVIFGDGEQRRAFSYIGDSLPSFLRAVEDCDALHGNIVNVGGVEDVSLNTLADKVCDAMGSPDHPRKHVPDRPLEVKNAWASTQRSRVLLAYEETVGWLEGTRRMASWALRQGPQEWRNDDPIELTAPSIPRHW